MTPPLAPPLYKPYEPYKPYKPFPAALAGAVWALALTAPAQRPASTRNTVKGVLPMPTDDTHDAMLPRAAYAITGDPADPTTWKLPHHHPDRIARAARGRMDIHKTVDWDHMPATVAALSPGGFRGQRVKASAEQIIAAAHHLAAHYRAADKPVPDTLQALL